MSFAAVTCELLALISVLLWTHPVAAAPVEARFTEGVGHAFLLLRTLDGTQIASGDLLQVVRGEEIESRMVFHFFAISMPSGETFIVEPPSATFLTRSQHHYGPMRGRIVRGRVLNN